MVDQDKKTVAEQHEKEIEETIEKYENQMAELKHEHYQQLSKEAEQSNVQQDVTIRKLSKDLEDKIHEQEETAMTKVHAALETVLRDTFKVEDGHRLSSM